MKVTAIIPARLASTRLPRKPLLFETGKYLIQHVYEQVIRCRNVHDILLAVDDLEVFHAVESFGGHAVMTDPQHVSGTDRIAEVAKRIDSDIIVNVQGDEPRLEPSSIDLLIDLLIQDQVAGMATLMTPIRSVEIYRDPNCVKVITDDDGRALCFSRAPIPYGRDELPNFDSNPALVNLHLGIYAYRRNVLLELAASPPHPWELCEKLEQLRFLARGGVMRVGTVSHAHPGIDTPADYAAFVRDMKSSEMQA